MASSSITGNEFEPAHQPNSALALLPPTSILEHVQPLRSIYDQAAVKWPPHINVFYPFVDQNKIKEANEYLSIFMGHFHGVSIAFDRAEAWKTGPHYTIVLRPSEASEAQLEPIYHDLLQKFPAFADSKRHRNGGFKPHMTIGQTKDNDLKEHLVQKAEKLCSLIGEGKWHVATLSRLDGAMRIQSSFGGSFDAPVRLSKDAIEGSIIPQGTFEYSSELGQWQAIPATHATTKPSGTFSLSTYNCMFEPSSNFIDERSRYQRLVKDILNTNSTILCLQEVSDSFLSYLLSNSRVRERYRYVSHNPMVPLLHWRNCITLSTHAFKWSKLVIDRNRTAIVASFGHTNMAEVESEIISKALVVVNVHLPSSATDEAVTAKVSYYQTIHNHLSQYHDKDICMVAGDFNLAGSQTIQAALSAGLISEASAQNYQHIFPEDEYVDTWNIVSTTSNDSGITFDPFVNELARSSVKTAKLNVVGRSKLPLCKQRYDRILLKQQDDNEILIQDAKIFGVPYNSEFASDHYGLSVSFMYHTFNEADEQNLALPEVSNRDEEIKTVLANSTPSQEDKAVRERAIEALRQCLKGQVQSSTEEPERNGGFKMELTPVGSYGLGTWDQDSDIDCLVVGNITVKTFWKLARQRVKRWTGLPIRVVRFVNAAIPMLILSIDDKIQVDLQYCTAVRLVEAWSNIMTLPHDDPLFNLPVATLKKLQAFRDMNHLLSTLPNIPNLRLAYRFIKMWAVNRGIYSSKFGYLGGVHITLLLSRICLLLPARANSTQILRTFFAQYASWDWATDTVWQPNLPRKIRYQRSTREKMVVLTVHAPAVNVAFNATNHTVQILAEELQRVDFMMKQDDNWMAHCLTGGSVQEEFLTNYTRYIKIEVQFWGSQKSKGRALIGWIESRCVMLLADLATKTPSIHARIWPKRFHEVANISPPAQLPDDETPEDNELRGFYLIGLSSKAEILSKEEKRVVESTFSDVLSSFEDAMKKTEAGKFDETDSWLQVRSVRSTELAQADHRVVEDTSDIWDGGVGGDNDSDDDSSDEEEEEEQDLAATMSSSSITKGTKAKPVQNEPTPKLRPSHEVLSRIRWDPTLDASDYIVGYEDRFRGVIEMSALSWKMEMSDEEFVPMHRIVWFKRRSDGEKVWDRALKMDKLFGSGVKH